MAEGGPHVCAICGRPVSNVTGDLDKTFFDCWQCGEFRVTGTGEITLKQLEPKRRLKLSGWVRDQQRLGDVPLINSDIAKRVAETQIPGVVERADRLLRYVIEHQNFDGQNVDISAPDSIACTYSKSQNEVNFLALFLCELEYLKHGAQVTSVEITAKGLLRYEELRTVHKDSAQGFVAMWFNPETADAYSKGFKPGIRDAGYRDFRVDKHEHTNKIDDEIIAQIRNSRFLVADFTAHRGGVYFEAGFALGLNLPVIWTCRKDHLKDLHFDTRQFNCIDWAEPAELAVRLQRRIEAVVGIGPYKGLPQ